jgi:hypothetical protein
MCIQQSLCLNPMHALAAEEIMTVSESRLKRPTWDKHSSLLFAALCNKEECFITLN